MNLLEYIQKNETIPADLKIIIGDNPEIITFEEVKNTISVEHSRIFDDYCLCVYYGFGKYSFKHISVI